MNANPQSISAADLRRAFDEAFTRPLLLQQAQTVELLAVMAGDVRMALRVAEIRGIELCPRVTELPSSASALLGIAALRAGLAGMYSLASLRGGAKSPVAGQWAVICGDGSVGLVFDELLGYARVLPADFGRSAGGSTEFVEIEGRPHLVVDVAALLKEILGT